MKKAKILSVLTVLLAMGLTACGGGKEPVESKPVESQPDQSQPAPSSQQGGGESQGGQSQGGGSSVDPGPQKDQTGHIWGADADVAGDAEAGTVAYKKAQCSENDGAVKLTVDQSVVTLDAGAVRKNGTPDGYLKLDGKNQTVRFKFNYDKVAKVKFYLYCCMDGWSSNSSKQAFSYQNKPNIGVTVNEEAMDIAALSSVVYTDFLGGTASDYSDDGYGLLGEVVLKKGVNEVTYTRLASMNVLVKHFVFVAEHEYDSEWGEAQPVAAAEGSIAYTKYVNNLDPDMIKVEWKSMDGTLAEGSAIKSGTPEGFLKLDGNTQKMNYAFNFQGNYDGQIYQRGAMDGYPGNANCTYFSQTKGAKYGNFEVKVNGSVVYYGDKRDVKYGDMLGTAAAQGDASIGSGYSEVKDCLIGDAFLKDGANTASFERVDSYNLAINYFMFIGKKVAAAHVNPAADAAYAGQDADSHWQVAEGDSFKFNRGEHHWVADTDETDTVSSCTVKGQKHYKCEICGMKRVEELELAPHTWVSDPDLAATDTESTCTTHGVAHMLCSVCGAKEAQELPLGEHAFTEGTQSGALIPLTCSACNLEGYRLNVADAAASGFHAPGKMKSDATWDVTGIAAGTYDIQVFCYMDNNDNRAKQGFVNGTENRYQWKSDNGDYVSPSTGTKTYADVGVGKADKVYCWTSTVAQITIGENSTSFVMHWAGSGYSLYVSGVRLLKAAA